MAAGTMGCVIRNEPFVRGKTYIPESNTSFLGNRLQFLVFREKDMQAVNNIQTVFDSCQELPAPFIGEITTYRSNSDKMSIWLIAQSLIDITQDGNVLAKINPKC